MKGQISDIEGINAIEDGRMIIFLKDETTIVTDSVDFHPDGTFETGYIFNS